MSARYSRQRPPYPKYFPTRFDGEPERSYGPPDLWPSAQNPSYSAYRGTRGRFLAGLGSEIKETDMLSADGIKDYANELDTLAAADDVVGNGLFDPPGTAGNIHADYGVFADHENLPGYVARDHFYTPSEVIDATTGRHLMYVPAGAVAIDKAQMQAFNSRLLWELPPGINPWQPVDVDAQSMVTPKDAAWPIGETETPVKEPAPAMNMFVMAAAAGVAIGIMAAIVWKKR